LFTVKDEGSPFHPSQEIPVKRALTASTPTAAMVGGGARFPLQMDVIPTGPGTDPPHVI